MLIIFLAIILNTNILMSETGKPVAKKIKHETLNHGVKTNDPFYWMNERDSKPVLDYIKQENDYTKKKLEHTEGLQSELFEEITGRIKEEEESVPYFYNGYFYKWKFEKGKEYRIYKRYESLEDVNSEKNTDNLLDENKRAKGHDYFALGGMSVSPNNKILAFSEDIVSRRFYDIYFKNIETGEIYSDLIKDSDGSVVWDENSEYIFYTKKDKETLREFQVWRHKFGTGSGEDVLVYEEKDEEFHISIGKSKTRDFIWIGSHQTLSTEIRYLDAHNALDNPKIVLKREREHEYSVSHHGEYFYITTNWQAQNFRLMKVKISEASNKTKWEEVIAHDEDVLLEGIELFQNYLIVESRKNGLNRIEIRNLVNNQNYFLAFEEETFSSWVDVNPEFETNKLRFGYSSLTTPNSIFEFDLETKTKKLLKEKEILGGFDKDNYQSERIWASAKDGEKIAISIVYKKGFLRNSSAPLLLYGYGSYGITIDPSFSFDRLSLLDRGFVFAIAHIRGSEYLGRKWYEDGKLLKKKNTFTDFIACAEHLIEQKYTSSKNIFAYGGSAGGLLMGAVANMRPDLFRGIISAVPFVDVVTTMLDETIPLTTFEYDEWGNPNEKKYFDYMMSYSPYDNVEAKNYPNMLIVTGYHDSQVQYWEPLKWAAKLREKNASNNDILLRVQTEAGHGGASGRFRKFKETALKYAFLIKHINK